MALGSRWRLALCLPALAIPSAWFSWLNRDVPCFSRVLHDDSIYFVCAKSVAAGAGYRIASLPGAPFQTKYPPLFPLLLSAAWRIDPSFPSNLSVALAINWLSAPLVLWLVFALYRDFGFRTGESFALTAALAVSPSLLLLGAYLLSELPFTALLLAALLLLNRADRPAVAAAAGAVASLASLTRSAGLPILAAGLLLLWQRKRPWCAFWFAAAMLPGAVGWTLWSHAHLVPAADTYEMYYTDYLGYYLYNVDARSLPVFLWRDADELLGSLGSYLLSPVTGGRLVRIACDVVAVAGLRGVVRLWRVPSSRAYALFGLLYAAPLLVWHYPSNQRLLFPVAPLFLAGLFTEGAALLAMLRAGWRRPERGQRVAAVALGALAGALLVTGLALQGITDAMVLPRTFASCRAGAAPERAAFRWIEANLPPGASILTHDDALLYLSTGHSAMRITLPPKPYYLEDRQALLDVEPAVAPYARRRGFGYVSWFPFDVSLGEDGGIGQQLAALVGKDPAFARVYSASGVALYRVR